LGGLLRDRLVGEDVDPDLPATLDLAGHRDTSGLDLTVGQPAGLERLQAVLAELHVQLPARVPAAPAAVLLAVLHTLGREHLAGTSAAAAGATPTAAAGTAPAAGTAGTAPAARTAAAPATPAARTAWAASAAAARATRPAAVAAAPASAPFAAVAAVAAVARRGRRRHVRQVGAGVALRHDLALVDPALDPDAAEGGARLVEAVVDVRPHR